MKSQQEFVWKSFHVCMFSQHNEIDHISIILEMYYVFETHHNHHHRTVLFSQRTSKHLYGRRFYVQYCGCSILVFSYCARDLILDSLRLCEDIKKIESDKIVEICLTFMAYVSNWWILHHKESGQFIIKNILFVKKYDEMVL